MESIDRYLKQLTSSERDTLNEEVISLQQQRIDLLQKFMSEYSFASNGATPRTQSQL
jgi:hypothetical protein